MHFFLHFSCTIGFFLLILQSESENIIIVMKRYDWKQVLPYVVAVLVFVALAVGYCTPLLEGKVLQAGDVKNWEGVAQEARE